MFKMCRLAASLLAATVVVLPLGASAESMPESPAIAVSIGATFKATGGTVQVPTPEIATGLRTLSVSVAAGDHAAVANSTASVRGDVVGSTANAGASNSSESELTSVVNVQEYGFESEVGVTQPTQIGICTNYPFCIPF